MTILIVGIEHEPEQAGTGPLTARLSEFLVSRRSPVPRLGSRVAQIEETMGAFMKRAEQPVG
jgi:hypothetical protein